MFHFEQEAAIAADREDLYQLVTMRFGNVPSSVLEAIYHIEDYATIERLILVAANAPTLSTFIEELQEGNDSFKIVGERFNPIEQFADQGDAYGGK